MSYSREQWAIAFLNGIGNNHPSQNVINWVINWTAAEGSSVGGQGNYNLLNTTQTMPGSTNFNNLGGGIGVQNFTSFSQGVQANDMVLENGLYPDLLNSLRNNDESSLGFGGSPSSGVMKDLNTWCGHCGYGGWFAHQAPTANWLGQQFQGVDNIQQNPSQPSNPGGNGGGSFLGVSSSQLQQFLFVTFGMTVIIIGVFVVFFSKESQGQAS